MHGCGTGSCGREDPALANHENEEGEASPDNQMSRGWVGPEPVLRLAEKGGGCDVPEVSGTLRSWARMTPHQQDWHACGSTKRATRYRWTLSDHTLTSLKAIWTLEAQLPGGNPQPQNMPWKTKFGGVKLKAVSRPWISVTEPFVFLFFRCSR